MSKYIKLDDAIDAVMNTEALFADVTAEPYQKTRDVTQALHNLPTIEVSENMGEVSDGYHTFNQLYHQRAVLFATIVNQNKDKAWKSWKHEDGKFCFDKRGEWFIVGIDTPKGSYTYHYEQTYWDMFDCEELDKGKHWDGHTEEDVTRLLSLPPVIPTVSEDCISREDFLKTIDDNVSHQYSDTYETYGLDLWALFVRMVKNAPSVVPSRAKSVWMPKFFQGVDKLLYECSNCHTLHVISNYCPNCGRKMKG